MSKLTGLKLAVAITGSFCSFEDCLKNIEILIEEGAVVTAIISRNVADTDTRFTPAVDFIDRLRKLTGQDPIASIADAEPIGPRKLFDVIIVSPCTGNTLSKIANSITDTPVTMAVKAHLRNERPVVIGVSTNDGLGANAKNVGLLLNAKSIFFVPFFQDNPKAKPRSIIADGSRTADTVLAALEGKQIQPIITSIES